MRVILRSEITRSISMGICDIDPYNQIILYRLYQSILSPAIHGSSRFPMALPQSTLSRLLDFFQFERWKWYFNMIFVWISVIMSDVVHLLLCLGLFVFSFFLYFSNSHSYPFPIFLLHCWSFSHWFIGTLYILGNLPTGSLYFDFVNGVIYNFVYGVACHTFFFNIVKFISLFFQLELQLFLVILLLGHNW